MSSHMNVPSRRVYHSGFALLPVAITITVIACIALLISTQTSMNVNEVASNFEIRQVDYVTQAGIEHAVWQAHNNSCVGDITIPTTVLGAGSYSATSNGGGSSTSYTLSVDQDAWIRSDDTDKNNGGTSDLHIRYESGKIEQPLVRFDLSTLPANAQINSASLWFYIESGKEHPEGPVTIHKVTADWTEDGVTWDTFNNSYDAAVIGTIPTQTNSDTWVQVNVTSQVQSWVNGEANFGILLNSLAEGIHAEYVSHEGVSSQQPRLEVIVGTSALAVHNVEVTGTLNSGVSRLRYRDNVQEYQVLSAGHLQPGPDESEDAEIWAQSPDNNYGDADKTWVSSAASDTTRSLLRFDIASIPMGAKIIQASMSLQRQSGSAPDEPISAHRITNDWSENSVTWNWRKTGRNWNTGGGDYDNTAIATTLVGGSGNQRFNWDITSLVQDWVNGSFPNYGVILVAGVAGMVGERFYTSDESYEDRRPRLSVTYVCECNSVCLAPQGNGKIAMVVDLQSLALTPGDQVKQDLFESWGYEVTPFDDNYIWLLNSSSYDLVYVSESASSGVIGTQLSNYSIGIVNEEGNLNDELGLSSGKTNPVGLSVNVVDNNHYITYPFPAGALDIYSVNMEGLTVSGTQATDLSTLAEWNSSASLAVLETGMLTISGDTAAGRRVMLPLGRNSDTGFTMDYLNNNGRLMVQRALQWASGNTGPEVTDPIYLSTDGDAALGGLKYQDTDVVNYNAGSDSAMLFLDSADVGLSRKIDALHILDNGNLILSTKDDTTFAGLSFKKEDLIEYDPVANSASMYLDADMHFNSQENIISVHILYNGNIVLSTDAATTLGGVSFNDNDLVEYNRSTGYASLFLDGDAAGISNNISALHILDNGNIILSTDGDTSLGGLKFSADQFVEYNPVADIATLYFDGNAYFESSSEILKSLHVGIGSGSTTNSPIAHWKLDEMTGTTAFDAEGTHNGTLENGPLWSTDGNLEGALDFDGVDDQVIIPHDDALSFSSAMTMSAWIKNESSSSFDAFRIISKESNGSNDSYWMSLQGGWLWMGIGGQFFSPGVTLLPDQWYHVAGTFDSDTGEVNMYINGALVLTQATSATLSSNTDDIYIGSNWEAYKPWNGKLDDVRLYNYALTVDQISQLSGAGGTVIPPVTGCSGNFLESFNSVSFAGDDGTLSWSTDWLEINESNGAASGDVRVRTDLGRSYTLRIRDNDGGGEGVQREVDLSAYTSAILNFLYSRNSLDNTSDYVSVSVSSNGGSSWTEITRIEGPATDSNYLPYTHDISSYIAKNTRIRFVSSSTLGGTDEVYFDDIEIMASGCAE